MEDGDGGEGAGTWHREAQREKQQGSYGGGGTPVLFRVSADGWGTVGDMQAGLAGAHLGAVSQCGWCSED